MPRKRQKIYWFIFLSLFSALSCRRAETWNSSTFLFFDTICEAKLFCTPSLSEISQQKIQSIFQEVEDRFSPDSKLVSTPLVETLFEKALLVYHRSSGLFDITVAPLSRAWGFRDGSYRIPSLNEIENALRFVGMDKIGFEEGHIQLPAGMELDWGGIAKGFGIDMAVDNLIQMGIQKGFLNAGGDLYCWGKNPDDKLWQIGIQHPRKSGLSAVLSVSDLGAATTGDYQRYFIREGIRYHHVFDPRTGYPSRGKQSVTVVGPQTLFCDALSTALFVSDCPAKILDQFPEYGAFIIDSGGNFFTIGKPYPARPIN